MNTKFKIFMNNTKTEAAAASVILNRNGTIKIMQGNNSIRLPGNREIGVHRGAKLQLIITTCENCCILGFLMRSLHFKL